MRLLDLFSGIGGFSLAAQWVWGDDLEIVAFCEINKFCQKVLHKHWPNVPIIEDVRDVQNANSSVNGKPKTEGGQAIGRNIKSTSPIWHSSIDLLTGGFPCQPFSCAGKRKAKRMTVSSGLKCSVLSKKSDPVGLLLKMLLESSEWNSTIVYLTWKAKVTPRGRLLFRLVPSMPRTEGTGFGLWPTMRNNEIDMSQHAQGIHGVNYIAKDGREWGCNLTTAVKMWPTATGRDYKDTGDCKNVPDDGESRRLKVCL